MCGIAGMIQLRRQTIPRLGAKLEAMNKLQEHRGPDGSGVWVHPDSVVGFGHRRLSIIDLDAGAQPMRDEQGNWVTFNGEIYNFIEIRRELGEELFRTNSDTEVILRAYQKWGENCVNRFRGMFAFAIWDESRQILFCARDRFGIKPFYYMTVDDTLMFASEVKALLPFVKQIETDREGFADYLTFQFCLHGKTLFKGVRELLPGHTLRAAYGSTNVRRYWEVYYDIDYDHTAQYFEDRVKELLADSVRLHLRSDVPVGAYLSGGLDSSIISSMASQVSSEKIIGFTGKFSFDESYDESRYARALAESRGFELQEIDITSTDFLNNIRKVIYHLDYPIAGPGSFPQYMVSGLAAGSRKVVLGGQGGDEIFGGYARYLIAYFEQCIRGAIDGTMNDGNFVVTYKSVIENLSVLKNYKPLLKHFWKEGLFEALDSRYFRLVDRSPSLSTEIHWDALPQYSPFESFQDVFKASNVQRESYFDSMTHFDFKTLLPALLHVEDRMSMAHGVESRVPLLDHPLVELAATIPSNIKFDGGRLKHLLRNAFQSMLPDAIVNRTEKMGFPVPLTEWFKTDARDFVMDTLTTQNALGRELVDNRVVADGLDRESKFSRQTWGLLSLEMWQQEFADNEAKFKALGADTADTLPLSEARDTELRKTSGAVSDRHAA